MPSQRREQLVQTAVQLFQKHGYHATGIDRILAEAGVAKMTLYKHFRSKDELILGALRQWDQEARNWLVRAIEARADDPAERLLALFDVLGSWFESGDFAGCMFNNASAEFADHDDPIHAAAAEHKRLFRHYLREQAVAAGARDPDKLTQQIALLMEGAIMTAQVSGDARSSAAAKEAAAILIEASA